MHRQQRIIEIRNALGQEWPSCVNCFHFNHGRSAVDGEGEHCGLDPLKRRPPARIIANGCPSFEQDIPF